ncbi:hypothetical protein C8J56DRAFT_178197 [Mycena floridula]|nr:hypothetical protein C8J56DRAFT_178197 [Mycena floridula]
MAFQTSSSPSPTSINGTPFTNPEASPPLILAFLCIGLFVMVMTGVFFWRRIRGWSAQSEALAAVLPRMAEEPRLTELWTVVEDPNGTDLQWAQIMPFSAVNLSPETPSSSTTKSPMFSGFSAYRRPLQDLKQLWLARKATSISEPPSASYVQVGVLIGMPNAKRRPRDSISKDDSDDSDDTFHYALGLSRITIHDDHH